MDDQFLDFTLEGHAEGWVAIGFSDTPNMVTTSNRINWSFSILLPLNAWYYCVVTVGQFGCTGMY